MFLSNGYRRVLRSKLIKKQIPADIIEIIINYLADRWIEYDGNLGGSCYLFKTINNNIHMAFNRRQLLSLNPAMDIVLPIGEKTDIYQYAQYNDKLIVQKK